MTRTSFFSATLGALALAPCQLTAADPDFSFYDASRPGRHTTSTMLLPALAKPVNLAKLATIYVVMDYEGAAKPTISCKFNGTAVDNKAVTLIWSPEAAAARWVKIKANVAQSAIKAGPSGANNAVEVTATFPNGRVVTKTLDVVGVSLPTLDQDRISGSALDSTGFKPSFVYHVPPTPIQLGKNFPLLGKYAFSFMLNGKLQFSPFEHTYTSETLGGVGFTISDREHYLEVGSKETSEFIDDRWQKTESKIYLGWSTSFTIWEKSFYSILPKEGQEVIGTIPFFGHQLKKTMEEFRLDLTANPSLYGEANLKLVPSDQPIESFTLGGEMDLRLSLSAVVAIQGLGKFGAQLIAGGKVDLEVGYPATYNASIFKSVSGEMYAGLDIYFLCFESENRYTLAQFQFPDAQEPAPPQGALRSVQAAPERFQLVPPPEADEQISYPLNPRLLSAPRGGDASLAAAKTMFRRVGTDSTTALRRAMPMAAPGSQSLIEGGVVLPLAENTTSVAWPSLATQPKDGGLLALFGEDIRKPGSDEKSAQFTRIRWTYCHNGEWSAATPLPAENGAAQIAPVVAPLTGPSGGFLAAWQQLENPNFQDTGLEAWLDQTQVAAGIFQPAERKWTTQLLGTPGRADISPRVAGGFGQKKDEGVVVWISTKIPESKTGEVTALPEGAEFRLAKYQAGKWTMPDSPASSAKAPKSLLAWDFSGAINGGLLVYSEDVGNGNSRIMFYLYSHQAKSPVPTWTGPVELSNVVGKNLNPKVVTGFHKGTGILSVVWVENDSLVVRTMGGPTNSKEILRPASEGAAPPDAILTALTSPNAGDATMAVSWTEQTPDGPSIMTSVFDPNIKHWSKPLAITPGEDLETLYAATSDLKGNLLPLYVHTDITYGSAQLPGGETVEDPVVPLAGREKILIGRFRPTRDLAFTRDGLTTPSASFASGSTVKLVARLKSQGMLGFPSVAVTFYHGDPKKGGKRIATVRSQKPLRGGETIELTTDWALANDLWDRADSALEVYAVIEKPEGLQEWNPDNNVAILHVDDIVLHATAHAEKAAQDGSATVEVTVHNAGFPNTAPFPVALFDYSGVRQILTETVPKVTAGGVASVNLELPANSAPSPQGGDFLVRVDPENTLKLRGNPKIEIKVHIPPATK